MYFITQNALSNYLIIVIHVVHFSMNSIFAGQQFSICSNKLPCLREVERGENPWLATMDESLIFGKTAMWWMFQCYIQEWKTFSRTSSGNVEYTHKHSNPDHMTAHNLQIRQHRPFKIITNIMFVETNIQAVNQHKA